MKKTVPGMLIAVLVLVLAYAGPAFTKEIPEEEPYPVQVVPVNRDSLGAATEEVNLMINGSFESSPNHGDHWIMYPEPFTQVYYEPDQARDGDWAMVQGRVEPDPFKDDEIAYYCWSSHELDGYYRFLLYASKECTTNDIHWLNHSRMSLIRYEPGTGQWLRFTDYFGTMDYFDCGPWFEWEDEAYWFDGLELYTGYDICLSIESIFPSNLRSYFWRDWFELWAVQGDHGIWLPIIWNRPADNPPNQ